MKKEPIQELIQHNCENIDKPAIENPFFYCVYCWKEFPYEELLRPNDINKKCEMNCQKCEDELDFDITIKW